MQNIFIKKFCFNNFINFIIGVLIIITVFNANMDSCYNILVTRELSIFDCLKLVQDMDRGMKQQLNKINKILTLDWFAFILLIILTAKPASIISRNRMEATKIKILY